MPGPGSLNDGSLPWSMSGQFTVNGSQAIEIRWRVSAGTGKCTGRYITLIRVA